MVIMAKGTVTWISRDQMLTETCSFKTIKELGQTSDASKNLTRTQPNMQDGYLIRDNLTTLKNLTGLWYTWMTQFQRSKSSSLWRTAPHAITTSHLWEIDRSTATNQGQLWDVEGITTLTSKMRIPGKTRSPWMKAGPLFLRTRSTTRQLLHKKSYWWKMSTRNTALNGDHNWRGLKDR